MPISSRLCGGIFFVVALSLGLVVCGKKGNSYEGIPSAILIKTKLISWTSTEVQFTTDIAVVDGKGSSIGFLSDKQFTLEGQGVNVIIPKKIYKADTAKKGPYSALLLLDQSGSITTSDPQDTRIEAAKIFFKSLESRDNATLASFAGYSYKIYSEFTSKPDFDAILDSLAGGEGGGTPLYSSINESVLYTRNNGPTENKAIIVFTDGGDNNGTVGLQQAIQNAVNSKVELWMAGLSSNINSDVLYMLAQQTGGGVMYTESAESLISYFGSIGNMLRGGVSYYTVQWTLPVNASKRTLSLWITISLDEHLMQAPVYIVKP
ncbi:MAG: VWA domain-containing protein [Nitrospinota bacterium]|nr:VWA domain-containing protein [Nitrospinota bacterium]